MQHYTSTTSRVKARYIFRSRNSSQYEFFTIEISDFQKLSKAKSDLRSRIQQSNQQIDEKPKKNLTEVKIKTLEEIRAEKIAKSQLSVREINDEENLIEASAKAQSPIKAPQQTSELIHETQPTNKRPASQGNRHIRIKRPKLADEASISVTTSPVAPKVEMKSSTKAPIQASAPVPDKLAVQEQEEELEGNYEDEGDDGEGQTGTMNDDELLLEIDNILGD